MIVLRVLTCKGAVPFTGTIQARHCIPTSSTIPYLPSSASPIPKSIHPFRYKEIEGIYQTVDMPYPFTKISFLQKIIYLYILNEKNLHNIKSTCWSF